MPKSKPENICSRETQLRESIKKNDVDSIQSLIEKDEKLILIPERYTSRNLLSSACYKTETKSETIQTLMDLSRALNANLEEGDMMWNPLHLAATNTNHAILDCLLKNLDLSHIHTTFGGATALHAIVKSFAAESDESKLCKNVQLLIQKGTDINRGDSNNHSAILLAAKKGYKNIIDTIVKSAGSSLDLDNHKDEENKSARTLILEKKLFDGTLPKPILLEETPQNKLIVLIKESKEDEFVQYFENLPDPQKYADTDDGSFTLLQYSCLKNLNKTASSLIKGGADVNKYLKWEDETPLKVVAYEGNATILKELLDHPQLSASSKILVSSFCHVTKYFDNEKYDYDKCCKIFLDTLEKKTLFDVNSGDALGNTPLHLAVNYADETTVLRLLRLGASLACKNNIGFTPIDDIKAKMLERHLDECVEFEEAGRIDRKGFTVVFNYKSLISQQGAIEENDPEAQLSENSKDNEESQINISERIPEKLCLETELISCMSKISDLEDLLKHPVIVSFLLIKWHQMSFLFYTNLIFYFVFLGSLFGYIFFSYVNYQHRTDQFGIFCYVILNVTFWILLLRELFQISVLWSDYLKTFENYLEFILIIVTLIIMYTSVGARKQLASTAILLASYELFLMFERNPKLSANVIMFKTVSETFFKLLIWYFLLILAFALSFYVLFTQSNVPRDATETNSTEKDQFVNVGSSLFKTLIMMTGEYDSSGLEFEVYPIVGRVIFSLFVVMMTIILLNLLNGLAVSDTQEIKNKAELVGLIARTKHISYVERIILGQVVKTPLMKRIQSCMCCLPTMGCKTNRISSLLPSLVERICLFRNKKKSLTILPYVRGKIIDYPLKPSNNSNTSNKILKLIAYVWNPELYLDEESVKRIFNIVNKRRNEEKKGKREE